MRRVRKLSTSRSRRASRREIMSRGLRNGINAILAAAKGEYKGKGSTVNQGKGGGVSWRGVILFLVVWPDRTEMVEAAPVERYMRIGASHWALPWGACDPWRIPGAAAGGFSGGGDFPVAEADFPPAAGSVRWRWASGSWLIMKHSDFIQQLDEPQILAAIRTAESKKQRAYPRGGFEAPLRRSAGRGAQTFSCTGAAE